MNKRRVKVARVSETMAYLWFLGHGFSENLSRKLAKEHLTFFKVETA